MIFSDSGTFSAFLSSQTWKRARDHHPPSFTPSEGSPPPAAGTQSGRAPSPAVSDERPGRAPMATDGRRAATCRQSEQLRRPFRPRMCADVLAYVGAYVRIFESRGAGAYTHGRSHPGTHARPQCGGGLSCEKGVFGLVLMIKTSQIQMFWKIFGRGRARSM